MTKIISRREAYGSQSGEKGADVRLGAGDAPLREAVASAAAAMERRVHVLDQSADVLPGVDDRVVIRAVCAREDGAAPAADLRRGIAQAAHTFRAHGGLDEQHVTAPRLLCGDFTEAFFLYRRELHLRLAQLAAQALDRLT